MFEIETELILSLLPSTYNTYVSEKERLVIRKGEDTGIAVGWWDHEIWGSSGWGTTDGHGRFTNECDSFEELLDVLRNPEFRTKYNLPPLDEGQ